MEESWNGMAGYQNLLNTVECWAVHLRELEADLDLDLENSEQFAIAIDGSKENLEALIGKAQNTIKNVANLFDFRQDIISNDEYSDNLKISIDILSNEEETLKNQLLNSHKFAEKLMKQKDMLSYESKQIEEYKNIIKSYQVLTKTTFIFSANGVKGIMKTENGPKVFDFPEDTSQREISESLWKMLARE